MLNLVHSDHIGIHVKKTIVDEYFKINLKS